MLLIIAFWLMPSNAGAATFRGNADIYAEDSSVTWDPANKALTVACWFKLSIPSSVTLSDDMVILVNQHGYAPGNPFAYLIRLNISKGNVEFVSQGDSGPPFTNTLIEHPYLERWYHVAVERNSGGFSCYIDGRVVSTSASTDVGNSSSSGFTIGAWGAGRYLYGEVQEFAVYQATYGKLFIADNMFQDQRNNPRLAGYYKLGYSTVKSDELKNFAPTPGATAARTEGTGDVTFDETDQAGEQSEFDSRRNGGRDALVPLSGGFQWQQTALARPTPGIAFDFRFGYSSANAFGGFKLGSTDPFDAGPLGPGWRHTFETRLVPAQSFDPTASFDTIGLMNWDGSIETWDRDQNTFGYFTRSKEYRGELMPTNNLVQFLWVTPERLTYVFRNPNSSPHVMDGRLLEIHDLNGNSVKINWDQNVGVITQVVDSVRGVYALNYNPQNLLSNVTFGQWQLNFAYATNRLISKTLTNTSGAYSNVNTTWQFQYGTNGLLTRIVDPRGNTNVNVQYDQYGRQTNQVDALGRATATRYGVPANRQITHIDPATNSWVETYDRKGHILAQQDPLGNGTTYTYDTSGNRISITEPLGWTTAFGYDDRANVTAKTNALGEITRWVFHDFFNKAIQQITPQPADANGKTTWTNFYVYDAGGNLIGHSDGLGPLVSYTYSTNGLVLTSTDANGHTTSFGYDTNGFLNSRSDPASNTWQYTLNDVGWRLTETTPLGDSTSFAYDFNGNTVQIVDPLKRSFTKNYDPNGNLVAQSDGKGQFTRYSYDVANQRTAMTNRATNVWLYSFTTRGKPDRVTNPLGNSTTNFYDNANRLIVISDPLGNTVTNQYDANGNLVAIFDPLGQRWTKTFDRLNRVSAEADPLGNTRQTAYDQAGRIAKITAPKSFASLHFYDGRGRLLRWVEPETWQGKPIVWLYDYDGVGNITNITDALGGNYTMVYSNRNERILERNQDLFTWQYAYDKLLRLKTQLDPNGVLRTREYDSANRLTRITLSTARADTYDYDDNDNPRAISRKLDDVAVATTGLTYDNLDRVTSVTDPNGQSVGYGFDALSHIVTLTYPGNRTLTNSYDAVGRLTNQMDWAGRQTAYAHDKVGRLLQRRYPNGVIQTNAFDNAGRIVGIQYQTSGTPSAASIQIALTYAYDRNGNKLGGGERGTLEWPLPALTDETAKYSAAGRLQDRQITQSGAGVPTANNSSLFYHYDPTGNMTNAVQKVAGTNSQSWLLAYDEDNRTTSIQWSAGTTNTVISNRYDALGRRLSRTVDNQTTRYVLDLSGSMERILCDLNPDGTTNWYVHGPDLCYRVDSSNNLVCYHADAMANVIALTGAGGTNLSLYAYSPYGRSLGATNLWPSAFGPQPFTFVGSQGVMEELPNLYFMRARYYSAEAGVFLSTDPVKKIGPGWRPLAYGYAGGNPGNFNDPTGLRYTKEQAFKIMQYEQEALKYRLEAIKYDMYADMLQGVYDALQTTESALTGNGIGVVSGLTKQVSTLTADLGFNNAAAALDNTSKTIDLVGAASSLGDINKDYDKLVSHYEGIGGDWSRIANYSATGPVGSMYKHVLAPVAENAFNLAGSAIQTKAGQSQDSSSNNNGGGGGSIANFTPSAGSYATSVNACYAQNPAPNSNGSGITTQSGPAGSGNSSGNSPFGNVVKWAATQVNSGANSITHAVRQAVTTVGQAISSAVTAIGNFLGWHP